MSDQGVVVRYYLPKSVIRVTATRSNSWVVDWGGKQIVEVVDDDVAISVGTMADTSHKGTEEVSFITAHLEDTAYTLSLHPDGRLKAFTAKQDSRLDEVVGAAAKLLGIVGGAALAIANPAASALSIAAAVTGATLRGTLTTSVEYESDQDSRPEPTPDETRYMSWARAFPRHAERGQTLYQTLKGLDSLLSEAAAGTVKDQGPGKVVR
jgi:hypothetical protein